jgi:tRNA (cytidine/uridine-2'-O-)-methyltransferase
VPEDVHNSADARVIIPMRAGLRSLNVITAAAMVAGEALRQAGGDMYLFPDENRIN